LAVSLAVPIIANVLHPAAAPSTPREAAAAIARDPLDIAALERLGLDLDRAGRSAEADAVFSFIGRRTWRDGAAEAWLLRRRLGQGRFDEAFENADAILRQDADGSTRPTLFPILIAAARYSESRPALEARLAQSPWWRPRFLENLARNGDPAGARTVFETLAQGRTPPTPEEYAPLVNRLVGGKAYRDAMDAWTAIAKPLGRTEGVRDGDFAGQWDHTGFTWSVSEGVGGASAIRPAPDGSAGHALRIDYDGFSSPALPSQLMVLAPGRYRVSWREQGDPGASTRLYWRVRCADSGQVLARAGDAFADTPGPGRWTQAGIGFEIPSGGCAGQWLELATNPGERRAPLTAWYAGFRLTSAA
jgi:hypothetical protein